VYCDAQVPPVPSAVDSQELHVVFEGATQPPLMHESPVTQALPQEPQSDSEVWRFWQPSAQLVSVPQFWVVP
jgi:hypothetical protein